MGEYDNELWDIRDYLWKIEDGVKELSRNSNKHQDELKNISTKLDKFGEVVSRMEKIIQKQEEQNKLLEALVKHLTTNSNNKDQRSL